MKKILLCFTILAFALEFVGCKEKTICGTSDYKVINLIYSDIVVELKFGDRRTTTIQPGDTQIIYHSEWCRDVDAIPSMPIIVLDAEMRIDGKVVPESIWLHRNWDGYTLSVTDELLEVIKE